MKVALCLSGQIRSIDLIKEKLLENIVFPNNCDIFCHTWHEYNNSKYTNYYNPLDSDFVNFGSYSFKNIEKVITYLNPTSFEFEYPYFSENTKSMFYSLMRSNDLKNKHEKNINQKYDVVIRSRYDILFETKLNINEMEENKIYLSFRPGGCGGVNDCFAYGSSHVMNIYCNLYNEYKDTERILLPCPEGILSEYLNNKKISLSEPNLEYSVIREDGGMIKLK